VETAKITGGKLDYLLASAGQNMSWDALDPIGTLYVLASNSLYDLRYSP
jgi:hypothetical protein